MVTRIILAVVVTATLSSVVIWRSTAEANDSSLPSSPDLGAQTAAAMRAFEGTVTINATRTGNDYDPALFVGQYTFPMKKGSAIFESNGEERSLPYPQGLAVQPWARGGRVVDQQGGVPLWRWERRTLGGQTDIWIDPQTKLPVRALDQEVGGSRTWTYQWNGVAR